MNLKTLLRTGSAAAIAAALSFGALPTIAHAAPDDNDQRRVQQTRGGGDGNARAEARQARQEQRAAQSQQRAVQPRQAAPQRTYSVPAQQRRTYQSPVAQERSGRDWNRSDRRSETGATRSGRDWNRSDRRSETGETRSGGDWSRRSSAQVQAQAQAQAAAQARAQAAARTGSRDWDGRRSGDGSWERNRTYSTTDRNRTYRDGREQTQNTYRSDYRDGNRTSHYRDGDRRSWSRDWRRDSRYDWSHYRQSNRNLYNLGRYYSPYSNYRYSRLSIGFRLNSLFFGSRYWINDPWQYRLPEAYGPYRWVRYYDDALLVDIYSGQVVDVIYDFFW